MHHTHHTHLVEHRILIGVIADEETAVGFLLAGIGESSVLDKKLQNFMMVSEDTPVPQVEKFFLELMKRKDIGVILIGADIFKLISHSVAHSKKTIPIVLEIPTRSSIVHSLHLKERAKKDKFR